MSFANLKSSRGSSIDKLVKAAEAVSTKTESKSGYGDDRFWKPTRDKAGNGYAVIRLLPCQEGEDLPCAQGHAQGEGGRRRRRRRRRRR